MRFLFRFFFVHALRTHIFIRILNEIFMGTTKRIFTHLVLNHAQQENPYCVNNQHPVLSVPVFFLYYLNLADEKNEVGIG